MKTSRNSAKVKFDSDSSDSEIDLEKEDKTESYVDNLSVSTSGAHGAGIDAFMALFSVIALVSTGTLPSLPKACILPSRLSKLDNFRNRINGPNPNVGILFAESSFVKNDGDEEFSSFLEKVTS